LGGGSSNAAFTLLGINMLLDLKLKQQRLYQLGSELGSDIDFFISQSRFAFIQGRGEKVTPLSGKVFRHLIVWPGVNLSTKMVYQNSRVKLTKHLNNVKMLNYALKKGDNFLLKKSIFNALEKTALSISGQLREAKEYLSRRGIFARVTGSGSALYTILDKFTHYNIKKSLPKGWFIFEVQTF
jgi:4-diphosphocytidyl-2-C-methyl-D-erythritol kinase